MKTFRVPRFICESSLGVGSAVGRLGLPATFGFVPLVLPFYFWDRVRQEKSVEDSNVDWVIVRPAIKHPEHLRALHAEHRKHEEEEKAKKPKTLREMAQKK